jgi:iron(II)-dependent oxidoreductase
MRARSRCLLEHLVTEEAYHEQPIPLRHPIVFYEGHLPAFAINTLVKWGLGRPGIHAAAAAYCRFRGRRLPTEAEYHRAAFGTPDDRESAHPWGDDPPRPGDHGK